MSKSLWFLGLLFMAGCASTATTLTALEESKLDPALKKLILGATIDATEYDITPGPGGERRYGVIVRTDNVDDLKRGGYAVTSVFGDVTVVRVTVEQLRTLASLPSVKNVTNGSKYKIQ